MENDYGELYYFLINMQLPACQEEKMNYTESDLRRRLAPENKVAGKPERVPYVINARIVKTSISKHQGDVGIPVITVDFSFGGGGQGLQFTLDDYDKTKKERVSSNFTHECIYSIMDAVGVENWEDLKGKYVRLFYAERRGYIKGVGHIIDDRWCATDLILEDISNDDEEIMIYLKPVDGVSEVLGRYVGLLSDGRVVYEKHTTGETSGPYYSATVHPSLIQEY